MSEEETTRKADGRRPEHPSVFERGLKRPVLRTKVREPDVRQIFGIALRYSSAVRKLETNEESLRLCVLVRQGIML